MTGWGECSWASSCWALFFPSPSLQCSTPCSPGLSSAPLPLRHHLQWSRSATWAAGWSWPTSWCFWAAGGPTTPSSLLIPWFSWVWCRRPVASRISSTWPYTSPSVCPCSTAVSTPSSTTSSTETTATTSWRPSSLNTPRGRAWRVSSRLPTCPRPSTLL